MGEAGGVPPSDRPPAGEPPAGEPMVGPGLAPESSEPGPDHGRSWRAPLLVAAAVVALVVAAGVVLFSTTGDDGVSAPGPDAPSGPSISGPPSTTGSADHEHGSQPTTTGGDGDEGSADTTSTTALSGPQAVVEGIREFVSEARGLDFREEVPVELLDEGEFVALLEQLDEEADAEAEAEGEGDQDEISAAFLRALRILGPDDDLEELVDEAASQGTLGFYIPEEGRLVVRGDDLTPFVRQTIAHELAHALDDQHFDIDRDELDELDEDAEFAWEVVVEGSAEWVAEQYRESLDEDDRQALQQEMASIAATNPYGDIPQEIVLALTIPYLLGPPYVESLEATEGRSGVDEVLQDPPSTSEQIVDPGAAAEDPVAAVPTPPSPTEPLHSDVFGAASYLILFPNASGIELARAWGGDAYVLWLEEDGTPCVRTDVVGDDDEATDRYAEVLEDWADEHGAATVERVGPVVRLTACA